MWTWNSLVATQTESAAGAPGYGGGWYALLIALFLCLSSLKAQADTYPAIREYKAWVGSGVAVGYQSPIQPDFQSAGRFAWEAWQLPSYVPPDFVKIDWFADSNCQSKAEPAFISQSGWVMVWVSYGRTGLGSCSWSFNYIFINLVCPYGGTVVVDQCYNAPPCQAPLTRDLKTGACILSCQPPDVTDPATGQCVKCPVAKLANPPFSDACSISLEASKGFAPENACGKLRDDMIEAAACIATKIKALSTPRIDYTAPSATIRTAEYQDHLRETWDKSVQLITIMNSPIFSPITKQACVQRKMDIDAHKALHSLKAQPSSAGNAAPHVEHRAIDIPEAVSKALINQVTLYSTSYTKVNGKLKAKRVVVSTVEDYMLSATVNPPACDSNLRWGGLFTKYDPVHFQLP